MARTLVTGPLARQIGQAAAAPTNRGASTAHWHMQRWPHGLIAIVGRHGRSKHTTHIQTAVTNGLHRDLPMLAAEARGDSNRNLSVRARHITRGAGALES